MGDINEFPYRTKRFGTNRTSHRYEEAVKDAIEAQAKLMTAKALLAEALILPRLTTDLTTRIKAFLTRQK